MRARFEMEATMPIEIAALAGTVVSSFLIPIAKKAVDEVRERLANDVSDKAADQASSVFTKVWDKVTGLFSSDAEKAVLKEFEENPEKKAQLVQAMLVDKLQDDEKAAKELTELVTQPVAGGAGGASIGQIIAKSVGTIGIVHAEGANISGVVGGVIMGKDAVAGGPIRSDPAGHDEPKRPGNV